MLYLRRLATLALLSAPLAACADDVGVTSASSSTSTETGTGDLSTSSAPTTVTPTSDPTTGTTSTGTTDPSTSTGPGTTAPATSTGPDSSSSTAADTTTGTSTATDTTGTSTAADTTGTSTGGVACPPGDTNCDCAPNQICFGMATCILEKCLPIGDGSCPYEFDFECDDPEFCPPGSDPFDCCSTLKDGNCEEFDFGGMCAPYSDFYDCGYCPFTDDQVCDAPDFCPEGTDDADCCATIEDGVCEEMQFGGMCLDGTDFYDCGYCPFENNGLCEVPFDCPVDTDAVDCCATPEDGVCEEMQFGGLCEDGDDFYDCGYCIYENDGFCDVPFFCPEGSDQADCCATPEDGNCEEMQFGGLCDDGSDFYDCGYCIYEDDGACDVPEFCPIGSDINDCA